MGVLGSPALIFRLSIRGIKVCISETRIVSIQHAENPKLSAVCIIITNDIGLGFRDMIFNHQEQQINTTRRESENSPQDTTPLFRQWCRVFTLIATERKNVV